LKNLITRALTGAIFVAIIVGGLCFHPNLFLLVFGLVTGMSLWEFSGLIKEYENALPKKIICTIGGVYLFFATFVYINGLTNATIYLPYLIFLMFVFISELYDKNSNPINNWAFTFLIQIYCAGSFTLLNLIIFSPGQSSGWTFQPLFALALFIFIWLNDTGAYLIGSMFGKHRLFERISPKKSWEGFLGGLIVVLLSSQVFAYFNPVISWYHWLALSAVVVVFGTWGDLVESLLKRTLGVKDSGNILPGHGGILDRFDSVMMAIPAVFIYLELFIRN